MYYTRYTLLLWSECLLFVERKQIILECLEFRAIASRLVFLMLFARILAHWSFSDQFCLRIVKNIFYCFLRVFNIITMVNFQIANDLCSSNLRKLKFPSFDFKYIVLTFRILILILLLLYFNLSINCSYFNFNINYYFGTHCMT